MLDDVDLRPFIMVGDSLCARAFESVEGKTKKQKALNQEIQELNKNGDKCSIVSR